MTALTRVRAALAAGERPSDDDVLAVCADAERYAWLRARNENVEIWLRETNEYSWTQWDDSDLDAAIDAALREPK